MDGIAMALERSDAYVLVVMMDDYAMWVSSLYEISTEGEQSNHDPKVQSTLNSCVCPLQRSLMGKSDTYSSSNILKTLS